VYSLSYFFFSSRRRHTRFSRDWSSDVCSSDLLIFPYRRRTAPVNPVMLSVQSHPSDPSGFTGWWSTRPYAGAASVLTGVTQEGSPARRWLSWCKCVGRVIGKSVTHTG